MKLEFITLVMLPYSKNSTNTCSLSFTITQHFWKKALKKPSEPWALLSSGEKIATLISSSENSLSVHLDLSSYSFWCPIR